MLQYPRTVDEELCIVMRRTLQVVVELYNPYDRLSVYQDGILGVKIDDDQTLDPPKKRIEVPDVIVSEFDEKKLWLQRDKENGGISDRPDDAFDIYHTYFGVAGLSLLEYPELEAIDPAYALPWML
ncbi:hypothetical protein GIB67_035167 [Kingdonia uniflora]|uniref:Geranylgeranyl transferase type II subunit beta n=1 Tax=Kingdonia uniflora TaxID=39325 RepID=A0A7J7LDW9_9MAGN|nr:hypothetical protein GIB67_035167 [Kingdonia uniflora]